ncbi:hypothetical protein F4861DRAFT_61103 [Xylaria intraflava]|nr:hypothetical protein F4861DRAFT_61103 [Xylaria intraflava]
MSLQRVWTRFPHTQKRAMIPWPAGHPHSSSQTLGSARSPYYRAAVPSGLRKHGRRHQLAMSYSNYSPRNPWQYDYNIYNGPPKPRAGRLKDMAIGSVLTIIAVVAVSIYSLSDILEEIKEVKEEKELVAKMKEIADHYDPLLEEAIARLDGSTESTERYRNLFFQQMNDVFQANFNEGRVVELGPLSRFPESHEFRGMENVEDRDTAVLMGPRWSAKELDELLERGRKTDESPCHHVFVSVFANARDLDIMPYREGRSTPGHSKLDEILRRLEFMVEKLYKDGELHDDIPTFITVTLLDKMLTYIHDGTILHHYELGPQYGRHIR